jgi:hypothetical protein
MIDGQRTTEHEKTGHLMTMRDALLAAKSEGKDLDDVIADFNRAIRQRLLRELQKP